MKPLFSKRFLAGVALVLAMSLAVNILTLDLPKVAADAINRIFQGNTDLTEFQQIYLGFIFAIFAITVLQNVFVNVLTETFSASLRQRVIRKVSRLSFNTVSSITSAKLLTNITSDVDAVKQLFSQGIVMIFSSLVLIVGASISMLRINTSLGLSVMVVIPLLLVTFFIIFGAINKYFKIAQENLDRLNKVINESIVGASLVKVLNSGKWEESKFSTVNEANRKNSIKIVFGFASLIPIISILANLAVLAVVYYGGSGVIDFISSRGGEGLTPGDYSAFFTYVGIFIGPVIMLGFVSSTIARSVTSIKRIKETLAAKNISKKGGIEKKIKGNISFEKVNLEINNKIILKDISFEIKAGTRNAIVGPTAAGKTQIFNLIAGLQEPNSGKIVVDGTEINEISDKSFFEQVALVFQDSVIFNSTIRENVLFNSDLPEANLTKAINTAELNDFVVAQEAGLDTKISERGSSLSGGQKQRLTLARALAIDPKVLMLDDFTARVDINTEKAIINNLSKNYPDLTLISITQKIDPIKEYDQILLIMEGELIAKGTHEQLLKNSFEYQQIFNSQQSTES